MKANTAVGLLLSAASLFILSDRPSSPSSQQRLAQGLALAVVARAIAL
ncbi:MAG: hypothetical protein ACHP7O_10105 [Burkholderiales bacterium]